MGKGPGAVIRRAGTVPAVLICGQIGAFDRSLFPNLRETIAIGAGYPPEYAMAHAEELLLKAVSATALPYIQ